MNAPTYEQCLSEAARVLVAAAFRIAREQAEQQVAA